MNDYHETIDSHDPFFKEFKDYKFLMLSNLISNKIKLPVLVSTGNFLIPSDDVGILRLFSHSLLQRLFFLYAITFGFLLEVTKIAQILSNVVGFDLTAKGHRKLSQFKSDKIYPERLVGNYNVLYPRGLDLPAEFPTRGTRNRFDFIFTVGGYDSDLVKRNSDFKFMKIGYPRYDGKNLKNLKNKSNHCDFNLDINKKTILWMPSRLDWLNDSDANVKIWINQIQSLSLKFNIILRPHPHRFRNNPEFYNGINKSKITLDSDASRELFRLYSSADIVICDYGGSIFSALYCNKTVILLNIPHFPASLKSNSDFYARDILPNFNTKEKLVNNDSILKSLTISEKLKEYEDLSIKARQYFFSTKSKNALEDASIFLKNQIKRT